MTGRRGRPAFIIPQHQLSYLLEQGFSVPKISEILGVGLSTIERRMKEYNLSVKSELDNNSLILSIVLNPCAQPLFQQV